MMNLYENIYSTEVEKKQLVLIPSEETSKYFSSCYLGIKDFLKILRNYPEVMYKIIKSSHKKYFVYHFNYFILNNFFEDVLSPNCISKGFIYIIEHLLKDIISKLKNPLEFIEKYQYSNLSFLLEGLVYNRDMQIYFNSILSNIIEDYSSSGKSSKILLFEVSELNNFIKSRENNYKHLIRNSDLNKKKELEKKQKEQMDVYYNIFRMRFNSYDNTSVESLYDYEEEALLAQNVEENEEFVTKYLQELNKKDLEKLIQNKDNKNLKDYIQYQLSFLTKNDHLFSNNIFLEKVQKSKESEKILYYYERNFMICINIIKQILEQINDNICMIPPIIKCILKILSDLLKKHYPHIKNIELYICMGEMIAKIISNSFSNQEYNTLISSILMSSRLKRNLNTIRAIFSNLISFKFYNSEKKSDYTPFNLYFLEKFNTLFDIYDKILDFKMAEISETRKRSIKLFHIHSNKNNINIENNINKEKPFFSIAICYNVEDITTLLNIIKHNLNYILEEKTNLYPIDEFKKVYEKLRDNKEVFKALKEKDTSTTNYYILFDIVYSNSFNESINYKTLNPFFKIEHYVNKKKDNRKDELVSAQNLLSELLMKIPDLDDIEININNYNNTKKLLNDLSMYLKHKQNIFANSSNNELKITIPLEWYINSLYKCLEKIKDKYKKKEYEKFFLKLNRNIEKSIEDYGFENIGLLSESINYIIQYREEYSKFINKLEEINLNNQVIEFINNEIIEVEIKFKYNDKEKYFEIYPKKSNYDNDNYNNIFSDNIKICYNISEFTQNFPDLIVIQKYYNKNLFDIEKEIKINECLNSYFDILNINVSKKFSGEIKDKVLLKIKKFIFEKLYNKTFPKYTELDDQNLYIKICSLGWVKPENLNLYNFDFDSIVPITSEYFKQIDIMHSPYNKLNIINKLYEIIFNALKYIKGDNFSNNDILNISIYIILKAKPEKILSNIKYLDIFEDKDIFNNNIIYLNELKKVLIML